MLPAAKANNDFRSDIASLEAEMRAMPEKQIAIETRHYFAPGIYAREITIPEGVEVIGKIHRAPHVNVVSKGRILVITEDGEREIVAPCTFVAPAGTKRAGRALEETVWTTFHAVGPNDGERDLDKLEDELIAPSFDALGPPQPIHWAVPPRLYGAVAVFYLALAAIGYVLWRVFA